MHGAAGCGKDPCLSAKRGNHFVFFRGVVVKSMAVVYYRGRKSNNFCRLLCR